MLDKIMLECVFWWCVVSLCCRDAVQCVPREPQLDDVLCRCVAMMQCSASLENLNLDRKRQSLAGVELRGDGGPGDMGMTESPLVPALVTTCCRHLLQYGLHTVGIFRVSSSKKRVRQVSRVIQHIGKIVVYSDTHRDWQRYLNIRTDFTSVW